MGDTVKVRALEAHSYNGKDYAAGATYDIAADLVDSIVAQRKAERASTEVVRQNLQRAAQALTARVKKTKPARARMTAPKKGKRK